MADAFQPKFVDLVRNTSSTQGTGNFTLGPAATGFTSFTAALQPGDSFYYSAIGIDKPQEREVGRGTLLSGGQISRSAVAGSLTNFSSGSKSIALIASAEWYGSAQQMMSAASRAPSAVADRAALASYSATTAYLRESGREGMFVWDAGDRSANVAADTRQGLYVAGTGDPTGKAGAWVRKFGGSVSVKWFGATGDGVTDDGAAFVAAITCLRSIAGNSVGSSNKASPKLFVPAGHYYLGATTIEITHTLIIEGEGGQGIGDGGGAATKLRWAPNTTGIRVEAYNTSGSITVDSAAHSSGAFSTMRELYLCGPGASGNLLSTLGVSEGAYHGIHAKTTVFLDSVMVEGFQGDGLYSHTSAGSGGADEGASNASRAYNCWFRACRNGVSLAGADANVWTFIGCQATYNRACGVDDQAFLTNTHTGWHTNGNGAYLDNKGTVDFPAYLVSNGGNRYCPVQGQETAASTTEPVGTVDTNVWIYLGPGGSDPSGGCPPWASGISLRCSAPYRTPLVSAPSVFLNPYAEQNQGAIQCGQATTIIAGTLPTPVRGGCSWLRAVQGFLTVDQLNIKSTMSGAAKVWQFGPQFQDPIDDTDVRWHTTGTNIVHTYQSWSELAPQTDYTLTVNRNAGVVTNARINHYLQCGGNTKIILSPNGVGFFGSYGSGKHSGTPADATDLASAIALVNDLKAALAGYNLIG